MNRKILQKVIDALKAGTPDKISYAMGILDTLIESLPSLETMVAMVPPSNGTVAGELLRSNIQNAIMKDDEGTLLDAEARAKIAAIKMLSKQ